MTDFGTTSAPMKVVIVGAGQAGGWVARTLRERLFPGQITLIGAEAMPPYERPSLSKTVLSGLDAHPPSVITDTQLSQRNIEFLGNTAVTNIDRAARSVKCSNGTEIRYDRLVLAMGGRARIPMIPGIDLPGVYSLRTLEDSRSIATHLAPGKRMLVIGGGWIGLEVAATAKSKGMDVRVVEASSRLCARSIPAVISDVLLRKHLDAGVLVSLNSSVTKVEAASSGGLRAWIGTQAFEVDVVVVGVGLIPNSEMATECGLDVDNGIVVDDQGQTSDGAIYAAGDITNHPNNWAGKRMRLESWANAQNQGIAVGRSLAGDQFSYDEIPWFWSDQYDINLQVLGVPHPDAINVVRGAIGSSAFTVFQFLNGRLEAVIAINSARDLKIAKRWMKGGKSPAPEAIADISVRLDRLETPQELPAH